jgi:glyoxylase-like metal-dependent hydrolase (beta-lactamase superfamily II)
MNSVVISYDQNALLVDPGVFPHEVKRLKEYLQKENLTELSVLLTHTHGDHISGWHAFSEYPTFTHVAVSKKSETVRQNDVRYLRGMYKKQKIADVDALTFPEPINYLAEAEMREISSIRVRFYHVPGHSIDMSAIVFPEENLIISGDMLIDTPLPFVLHSIREYWYSLFKLKRITEQFNLSMLIPGHSRPANNQEEILRRILKEQKYIQKLVLRGTACLKKGYPESKLKKNLLNCFPGFEEQHAHQSNIQTFIREQEELHINEFSQI